jgi:hypothetical protein
MNTVITGYVILYLGAIDIANTSLIRSLPITHMPIFLFILSTDVSQFTFTNPLEGAFQLLITTLTSSKFPIDYTWVHLKSFRDSVAFRTS